MEVVRGFNNAFPFIVSKVKEVKEKPFIISIAGTSASGKSSFAERLREQIEKEGYKVLMINADNFYKPDTYEYYAFYDTYDHQDIVDLQDLRRQVMNVKEGKSMFTLPLYSFEKATRVGYKDLDIRGVDVLIVEGAYVINALHDVAHFNIYVKSYSLIEEIIRRMVRDSEGERLEMEP